jgi:hypothetical protein
MRLRASLRQELYHPEDATEQDSRSNLRGARRVYTDGARRVYRVAVPAWVTRRSTRHGRLEWVQRDAGSSYPVGPPGASRRTPRGRRAGASRPEYAAMAADDRLVGVRQKIERAKKHIVDLQGEVAAFKKTNPYPVATKNDPQTGELIYYVVSAAPLPLAIPTIMGDAIQNLRSALDHLAYQLVCANTAGTPPAPEHTYFPIFDTAEKCKAGCAGKIKGAANAAAQSIISMEPYQGGKSHEFWMLDRLNNTDKHRLLLAVSSSYRRKKLREFWSPGLQHFAAIEGNVSHDLTGNPFHPLLDESFDLSNPIFPLKAGDELHRNPQGFEPNKYASFPIEVVLDEPQVPRGEPILPLLVRLVGAVEGAINELVPFL